MSIATLKKKTEAKYNNLSVGLPHFSINGALRNQGYVGQTSLSRSTSRTLYNGIYPRGYGGCCGTFKIGQMVQSGILPLNDPKVIKASVINTKGALEEEMKCLNSIRIQGWNKKLPQHTPLTTVKPDNNQHNNTQSNYITSVAKKAIQGYNICNKSNKPKKTGTCANDVEVSLKTCNYAQDLSEHVAISQGEYLMRLSNSCVNNDEIAKNPTSNKPILGSS
jgi:hypothetical protein